MTGKLQQIELLVQRMLETARLEASRFEFDTKSLGLRRVVERVAGNYRVVVQSTHTVTLSCPDEPVVVRGDQRRLETVVSNLMDNAIKYSPYGAPVGCLVAHSWVSSRCPAQSGGLRAPARAVGLGGRDA